LLNDFLVDVITAQLSVINVQNADYRLLSGGKQHISEKGDITQYFIA